MAAVGSAVSAGGGATAAMFSRSSRSASWRASSLKADVFHRLSGRAISARRSGETAARSSALRFERFAGAFPRRFPNRLAVKSREQYEIIQACRRSAGEGAVAGDLGRNNVGRKRPRRRRMEEFMAAQRGQPRQRVEVAAHAETAIAGEIAFAIEQRQARQFHRQMFAAIDRPVQRDAAPGVVGGECREHAPFRIEPEARGDVAPRPAKPAAVRAPIRLVNSSEPSVKRPSASICHMKRSGALRASTAASSSQAGSCGRFGWFGRWRRLIGDRFDVRRRFVRTIFVLGRNGFRNRFRDRFLDTASAAALSIAASGDGSAG